MPGVIERTFTRVLAEAGVEVGGSRGWDPQILDSRLWGRVARQGLTGLGDAYVDGWWECDALDEMFCRLLRADAGAALRPGPLMVLARAAERLVNLQTRRRARRDVRRHYNQGEDLFEATLDARMVYSCALWEDAATLDEAQEAKLEAICVKLGLAPGLRLLDIGCGWGGLCRFVAERFGCEAVGITLSENQAETARRRCAGLPVEIRVQDYRDVRERFDRVVSVGMFEHVGQRNHRAFMEVVRRSLDPEGLALLHFFATQRSWPNTRDSEVLWVRRHIFPGMVVPSLAQVGRALEEAGAGGGALDGPMVVEDVENIGAHYDRTLRAWCENFERNWPKIADKYGDRFRRMWRYYLLLSAGAFRSRKYQVWQFVLSPRGVVGGYRRPVRGLRGAGAGDVAVREGAGKRALGGGLSTQQASNQSPR